MEIKYRNVYYQSNIYTNVIGVFRTDILHTLDSIPVAGSHSFTDGQDVTGMYELKYQGLSESGKWIDCPDYVYNNLEDIKRNIIAVPAIPTPPVREVKSAEDVLKKHLVKYFRESFPDTISDDDLYKKVRLFYEEENAILAAMEEYASQSPHKEGYSVEDMEGLANFIGKEDLKKYADGWCQPGGSNGFHWSTPELVTQFLNQLKK